MGDYWLRVFGRAASATFELFGWGSAKRLALRFAVFAGAAVLLAYLGRVAQVIDQLAWAVSIIAVGAGLFTLVFVCNFIATPHRMDRQLRKERDVLREGVETKQHNKILADELEQVFTHGTELLNRRVENFGEWTSEVIDWFHNAEAAMEGKVPEGQLFMFRSISPVPRPKEEYEKCKANLDARLTKLRFIIGRLLE